MSEVLDFYSKKIDASTILNDLSLKSEQYFVISSHREENVDNNSKLKQLIKSLNALIEKYNYPVIFSTHPGLENNLKKFK